MIKMSIQLDTKLTVVFIFWSYYLIEKLDGCFITTGIEKKVNTTKMRVNYIKSRHKKTRFKHEISG